MVIIPGQKFPNHNFKIGDSVCITPDSYVFNLQSNKMIFIKTNLPALDFVIDEFIREVKKIDDKIFTFNIKLTVFMFDKDPLNRLLVNSTFLKRK